MSITTQNTPKFQSILFLVLIGLILLLPEIAFASAANSGEALEWEAPMSKLIKSITGPVAFYTSMGAFAACLITLIFGAEINDIVRKLLMIVMVTAGLLMLAKLLNSLFGVSATIPL